MASMSVGLRPASSIAARTANVPIARVVLPEPRVYVVSPTPTMAYLSRRYFGVELSVSAGSGMCVSLPVAVRQSGCTGSGDASTEAADVHRHPANSARMGRQDTAA